MLDKLERKYGNFGIRNLTVYILIAYAIGYLTEVINPTLYSMLIMNPEKIFEGQVWRLFTWICTVPQSLDIFTIFMFMFFYFVGTNLERTWGTFRYTVFILSGIVFMTVGAVAIYGITYFVGPSCELGMGGINLPISTYYINLSSFLAFAMIYGDTVVYFMFVLPLKVKYLAVVDLLLIGYDLVRLESTINLYKESYGAGADITRYTIEYIWCYRIVVLLSILNFAFFYFGLRKRRRLPKSHIKKRNEFRQQVRVMRPASNSHKCYICGRTSETNPELVFRFCSKCNGNYEYCQEHLFTHQHVE